MSRSGSGGGTPPFAHLGTIPILCQQRDWVGGVRKMAIFADIQYYLLKHGAWARKVQKFADVI